MKTQPFKFLKVTIIGQVRNNKLYPISISNPNEQLIKAGFKPQEFIQCLITTPDNTDSIHYNIFKNTHCQFFNQLRDLVREKKIKRISKTNTFEGKSRPIILHGKIIRIKTGFNYQLTAFNNTSREKEPILVKSIKPVILDTIKLLIPKSNKHQEEEIIESEIRRIRPYQITPSVTKYNKQLKSKSRKATRQLVKDELKAHKMCIDAIKTSLKNINGQINFFVKHPIAKSKLKLTY